MSLPKFNDDNKNFQLMQSAWATQLDPLIENPTNQSSLLTAVALASGTNTINHKLGRKLQGWKIVRQRSAATFYDNQDRNTMPQLTLILIASAAVNVDIEVF